MAVKGETSNLLEFPCALDSSHRVPANQYASHYLYIHDASDTALSEPVVYVQRKRYGSDETNNWAYRDVVLCPICARHGVVALFRVLRQSEEVTSGDSLESHLRGFHGAT